MPTLTGFSIRKPLPHELPPIHAWFPNSPLHPPACLTLAAFGHPTPTPLGAIIVRPARDPSIAHFQLHLIPEARIPGANVDRTLFQHLLQLARQNNARRLILADLLPGDHADNTFWRSLGLTPETTLHTYALPIQRYLTEIANPLLPRIANHPTLRNTQFLPLTALDPALPAAFLATHYSGFTDHLIPQLASDHYNKSLSLLALQNQKPLALTLSRTSPNNPAGTLDLILTAPHTRPSPLPLAILTHTARAGLAANITTVIFQSDPAHDPFPTTITTRLNLKPTTTHHRYALPLYKK